MSNRTIAFLVAVMAAWSFVSERVDRWAAGRDPAVVEEIHRTFVLEPGARVEVSSAGAPVKIETSDRETAEVVIVRSAKSREAMARHRVTISGDAKRLVVRAESPDGDDEDSLQSVTLLLPRSVDFASLQVPPAENCG